MSVSRPTRCYICRLQLAFALLRPSSRVTASFKLERSKAQKSICAAVCTASKKGSELWTALEDWSLELWTLDSASHTFPLFRPCARELDHENACG